MKIIIAIVLLAIVNGSFIADRLNRKELVRDGLKKFNS
jgi:hypothetical protein